MTDILEITVEWYEPVSLLLFHFCVIISMSWGRSVRSERAATPNALALTFKCQ